MMPFAFMSVHLAETAYFKQKAGIQGFLLKYGKKLRQLLTKYVEICIIVP